MAARGLIRAALAAGAAICVLGAAVGAAAFTPKQWLFYFRWDSTEFAGDPEILRPNIEGLLDDIVFYSREAGFSRVVVVGHADTSGEASYNERLSVRRAERIASELRRRGLKSIAVEGRGERQPAVATGDGFPEPLNRRAEIVYLK